MNKIVDRDTFLYYLDNADVDWEATARECIAKGFELAEENKKLKEKLEKIAEISITCLEQEYCSSNCKYFEKCDVNPNSFILKVIEGAEE